MALRFFLNEEVMAMEDMEVCCSDPVSTFKRKVTAESQGVCLAYCLSFRAKIMLFIGQSLTRTEQVNATEALVVPMQDSSRANLGSGAPSWVDGEIVRSTSKSGSFLCPTLFPQGLLSNIPFAFLTPSQCLLPEELSWHTTCRWGSNWCSLRG